MTITADSRRRSDSRTGPRTAGGSYDDDELIRELERERFAPLTPPPLDRFTRRYEDLWRLVDLLAQVVGDAQ